MLIKRKVILYDRVNFIRIKCKPDLKRAIRPCKNCIKNRLSHNYCNSDYICLDINMKFSATFGLYKYSYMI